MGFSKCTQTWYYIVPYLVSICDLKNLDSFCGTWHKPLGWAPFFFLILSLMWDALSALIHGTA